MSVKVTITKAGVLFEPSDEPLFKGETVAVLDTWSLAVDWAKSKGAVKPSGRVRP